QVKNWSRRLDNMLRNNKNQFTQFARQLTTLENDMARMAAGSADRLRMKASKSPAEARLLTILDDYPKLRPVRVSSPAVQIDPDELSRVEAVWRRAGRLEERTAHSTLRVIEAAKQAGGPYTVPAGVPPHWRAGVFEDAAGQPWVINAPVVGRRTPKAQLTALGDELFEQLGYRVNSAKGAPLSQVVLDTRGMGVAQLEGVLGQLWAKSSRQRTIWDRLSLTVNPRTIGLKQIEELSRRVSGNAKNPIRPQFKMVVVNGEARWVVTFYR
ncbi:MAG TPA: hypothetical protein VEY30_06535, partial [Myxococcaceae bacterium]|nr:hypothetical protein [Myxococcaceae bacterium]